MATVLWRQMSSKWEHTVSCAHDLFIWCLSFFPDLWKANVLSEHTVENEVWWLPHSKLKENYRHCDSRKNIFPEFKLKRPSQQEHPIKYVLQKRAIVKMPLSLQKPKIKFHCPSLTVLDTSDWEALLTLVCVWVLMHVCKLWMHPPDEERAL